MLMRTNIEIDDQLMEKAMKLSNASTKKETVEQALKALIRREQQRKILKLKGKVVWEGNLAEMRYDHPLDSTDADWIRLPGWSPRD